MRTLILATAALVGCFISSANAQVELKTYADANGYINVQKLTCAQLAGTFQEDASLLMTWYSGWYNGLGKKHFINVPRAKEAEHEIIVYCKDNPKVTVIKAIGLVFDKMRKDRGIVIAK
ncbi:MULTISPECIES: HdeA family protein [Bosea]|uniref:HdeA family protein n=1 Tax=Bosea rubneri TaxID=3075434 RepID=A0ABU3SDW1_9HYPH|nr:MULTISPECIES: HdeA family protein [unclassified Bosea (in: a-proteobacteria)]MDU0342985.1 HdeA family protein [Bosea sp. ZW T0_25]UZF91745.1 HdeA family protein [Bosea sp. NBC_00550]